MTFRAPSQPRWIRFDRNGVMHLDAELYARERNITLDAAADELRDIAAELLPDATVTVVDV
jgi:hypothetical protein